jgi:FkbM family methyltransferase
MAGNFRSLERNLELNGIRARAFLAAINVADGFVAMESASRDWGHRVAVEHGSPAGESKSAVPAISVPTVMRQMGWSSLDLVKIDIEGHEKALFGESAGWVRTVNAILIEWHHPGAMQELQAIADAHGMRPPRQLPGVWFLEREHWV